MFKYETWFMWTMLIAPIVLGLVLALVVPSYLERTRVTRVSKCEQAGGTWDREAYACVKPPESN